MHIDDLRAILPQVGFDYAMPGPAGHWQELCPACKRKSLSMAQMRIKEESSWLKRRSPEDELTSRYGPHLNYIPPGGWQDETGQRD